MSQIAQGHGKYEKSDKEVNMLWNCTRYRFVTLLIGAALCFPVNLAFPEPTPTGPELSYDYPIASPYAATVVGTPKELVAQLPERIPTVEAEVTVFQDREVPEVLWYSRSLRYSFAAQDHPAPLIFMIAGTGAGFHEGKMQGLQRIFYQAGFHVVSLSSPTHPNFIVSASTSGLPGHFTEDAQDLYRVMTIIWSDLKSRLTATKFYLTGYSLGAAQAAFVSNLDEQRGIFGFEKVLMINPPVSLYNSVSELEDLLVKSMPGGDQEIVAALDEGFVRLSEVYRRGDFVNFSGDFLYAAYRERQPPDERLAALIAVTYRVSNANLVFTSDVLTNAGYIKPLNQILSPTDSVTEYFKVAMRTSFHDYFHDLFAPHFRNDARGLTEEELIAELSLTSIEAYLRRSNKVGLVHNADDFILKSGELDYLKLVFGSRARIYPRGGHCGNFLHRDNVAYYVKFFADPVQSSAEPEPTVGLIVRGESPAATEEEGEKEASEGTNEVIKVSFSGSPDHFIASSEMRHQPVAELIQTVEPGADLDQPMHSVERSLEPMLQGDDQPVQLVELAMAASEQTPRMIVPPTIVPPKRSAGAVLKPGARYLLDVYDPIEGFNRWAYRFNAKFDDYVFLPVVRGYEFVMPEFVQDRVSSVFSNIADIRNFMNAFLQLKPMPTLKIGARFLLNTTVGLGGLWDPATRMGFPKRIEDFGQTLGRYGVGPGPYLVLPIFGPSSVRDGVGLVADFAARYFYLYVPTDMDEHVGWAWAYSLSNSIDTRHTIPFRYYQTGSPFEYDLIRFLYTKKREFEVAQ